MIGSALKVQAPHLLRLSALAPPAGGRLLAAARPHVGLALRLLDRDAPFGAEGAGRGALVVLLLARGEAVGALLAGLGLQRGALRLYDLRGREAQQAERRQEAEQDRHDHAEGALARHLSPPSAPAAAAH